MIPMQTRLTAKGRATADLVRRVADGRLGLLEALSIAFEAGKDEGLGKRGWYHCANCDVQLCAEVKPIDDSGVCPRCGQSELEPQR